MPLLPIGAPSFIGGFITLGLYLASPTCVDCTAPYLLWLVCPILLGLLSVMIFLLAL
jgi:hypothetical protein